MKYTVILFALAALTACRPENKTQRKAGKAAEPITLTEISHTPLASSINLPGELKPYESVELFPKLNSFVRQVLVDMGSRVKKGQLLMVLEAPEMEQQYFAAQSKYLQANSMFMASKDAYERLLFTSRTPGTVSAHELTMAKSKMVADSAMVMGEEASYRGLDAMMQYLKVTAPFDGVITERNIHPGALVGPNIRNDGKPMLVVQQEEKLRLSINVPEVFTNQLSASDSLVFHVSTLPGKKFKGIIQRSAGSLDLKFRSEAIEVDVPNGNGQLKPGMYAEVELPIKRNTQTSVVPVTAVLETTEGKFVIAMREGHAQYIAVKQGNSRHDSTEVFGDIHPADKLVLHANEDIKNGTPLTK